MHPATVRGSNAPSKSARRPRSDAGILAAVDLSAIEILAQSAFYRALSDGNRERLAAVAHVVRLSRGDVILRAGFHPDGVYVVGSGVVALSRTAPGGKTHVIKFVEPCGSFAEAAVVGEFPTPVDAIAMEETLLLRLPPEAFLGLMDGDPEFMRAVVASVVAWSHFLVTHLESMVLHDATARVSQFLGSAGKGSAGWFQLAVLKRELAQHLDLANETLSRALGNLKRDGLIEVDEGRIRVLDSARLADIVRGAREP